MLSINLLGSPAVMLDDSPLRGFVSSRAAALLYYLAATGHSHSREALAGLLWPDITDDRAGKNLRDVIANLRRLLGPHLEITRQTLALIPGASVSVDSRRFADAIVANDRATSASDGAARLREALADYGGDFLAGFSLDSSPEFESWAQIERERLRQLALGALQRLAAHAGHQGDYRGGIEWASRLIAIDPLREEAHRQLMLLLALDGQRGAALAQYDACRRTLADELGIDPDAATEALHRRILDGDLVGGRSAPAPLRPHDLLPMPLTALVGRAGETAQVIALLSDPGCRLVTVMGPGGVGKTSLALYAAHQLVPASQRGEVFAHGLVFVGLGPLQIGGGEQPVGASGISLPLVARIADALGFTFVGPEAPQQQLTSHLREKELLLLLDNCEHLPVSDVVVMLLESAPRLKILATSRRRLNVGGEQIVELDGLAFPSGQSAAHASTESYSALQLFRSTAQAVSPRLEWTGEARAAATRVCQLVAGLPLAIDLAARMARLMPVEEIAREIAASLEFLQSSRRDLPARHQSLRAVFDHSWRLLSPVEQRALRQLAVFRGGFSREAAAQVATASLPLLATLVDNSLVRRGAERGRSAGRYELLDLVRQYAAEQLADAGGEQGDALDRHCRYYLALISARATDLRGRRQLVAADAMYADIENIRAAWGRAVEQGDAELIGAACEGLFFFYEMRSWFREGVEIFAQAADRLRIIADRPLARVAWGKLLARQGWCAFQIGRPAEAQALLRESLAALRALGAVTELVLPLNYQAALAYYSGDYVQSQQIAAEALQVSLACGDRHGAAVALTVLGQIAALVGRYDDARRYSEQSLAIEHELGNRWGMAFPLISLGKVARTLGSYQEAQRHFQEGLAIRQAFGDTRGVALCLQYLGETAEAMEAYEQASWFYREALALFQAIGNQDGVIVALAELGYNALSLHDKALATSYFHRALRVAWQTAATPRTLEVLVGIAGTLADTDPRRAYALGLLAQAHPASTQESRDRAAAIIARIAPESRGDDDLLVPQLERAVRELLDAGPERDLS